MNKITSSYIRERRLGLNLTQKALAERLEQRTGRKVTRDMIAQYECDRAWVPGDIILALQGEFPDIHEPKDEKAA